MSGFVLIEGQIQAYQWGGFEFIPNLLSKKTDANKPSAEYWLGCHPSAPSVVKKSREGINHYLQAHSSPPLQFLFKILDVKEMLSIQSHPTKQQAKEGFERENNLGIKLSAKNRNYKDDCDKPELMVALSPFWLLHGIKTTAEIKENLGQKNYLSPLLSVLNEQGLEAAFEFALNLEHETIVKIHNSLLEDYQNPQIKYIKSSIDYWIAHWVKRNPTAINGILTLFFLNLVKLNAGEAIYQPPGLLHAYLEGQNVELMANSDNVLRAGLTPKHIDVKELINTCTLSCTKASDYIIQQKLLSNQAIEYTTPFKDFQLEEINASRAKSVDWKAETPEIVFCYQGTASLQVSNMPNITLQKGDSLLILPGSPVKTKLDGAILYKAKNT